MYVEYQLPQDGIQGDIVAYDADGEEVQVSRILYKPYFFKPSAVPAVLFTSLHTGELPKDAKTPVDDAVQRSVMLVSGAMCRLRFQDRTAHVKPLCEDPKKEKEVASGTAPRKPSKG